MIRYNTDTYKEVFRKINAELGVALLRNGDSWQDAYRKINRHLGTPLLRFGKDNIRDAIRKLNVEFDVSDVIGLPTPISTMIGGRTVRDVGGTITIDWEAEDLVPMPSDIATLTYYVDVDAPNDSADGLTPATPKGYIHSAITLGNASGATSYSVCVVGGKRYPRGRNHHNGTTAVVPTKPCRIYSSNGLPITVVCGTNGTWTLNTGTTYQRSSSGANTIGAILALDVLDAYGVATAWTRVADVTTCRATPGSWFDNGTTTYVNRLDGAAVTNDNTAVLLQGTAHGLRNSTSGNTWIENVRVYGGTDGGFHPSGNLTGRLLLKDCESHWATNTAGDVDGVQSLDIDLVVMLRCKSSRNDKDAFNFHEGASQVPKAVAIDCEAWENGTFASNTSCNGITIHEGGALLDIRGSYHHNHGASCAHINADTIGCHIGTTAADDYGDEDRGGLTGQAPGVGFVALTDATLYHYACTGTKVASGGTLVEMELL